MGTLLNLRFAFHIDPTRKLAAHDDSMYPGKCEC